MWIGFVLGWVLGSATFYAYLYLSAKEAPDDECVECSLPECVECPYQAQESVVRAA